MKKILLSATLALGIMGATFANPHDNVSEKVAAAFKHEFVQAKEVSWQKTDNYYKAIFKLNEDILTAYFSEDGEMMGVVRNLLSTELSINLQTSLKRDYAGYWVTDLFEFAKKESSGYFITLENADQRLTLKSTDGLSWSTHLRTKK